MIPTASGEGANGFVEVADASQILVDQSLSVRIADRELVLFRLGDEVFALDASCPHRGGPLGAGPIENGRVSCPLHGWEFDIRTGACADHPDCPARSVPVRVHDGKVRIYLESLIAAGKQITEPAVDNGPATAENSAA